MVLMIIHAAITVMLATESVAITDSISMWSAYSSAVASIGRF